VGSGESSRMVSGEQVKATDVKFGRHSLKLLVPYHTNNLCVAAIIACYNPRAPSLIQNTFFTTQATI
jgi:hypothetical protein